MKILVAGDIHGRVEQLDKMASAIKPDVVIQVGDMGFFSDRASMDRPARRHVEKQPEEGEIFTYIGKAKSFPCPLYFVRGNHEDFSLLEKFEDLELANMFYMRSGIHSVGNFSVAAIGGIYFRGDNPKKAGLPKFTTEDEVDFMFQGLEADILITHDAPDEAGMFRGGLPGGSPYVSLAIEALRPCFAFHGHYASSAEPYRIGDTTVFPMTAMPNEADEKGLLRIHEALLGLLEKNANEAEFRYIRKEDL